MGKLDQGEQGLLGGSSTLFVVASPAGGYDIFPVLFSPLGDGNHMIKGEILCTEMFATILAAMVISKKDIGPGKFNSPLTGFHLDHF